MTKNKQVEILQKSFLNDKFDFKKSELEALNIDLSEEPIIIGNLQITKKGNFMKLINKNKEQFYKIEIFDCKNDLNNIPIIKNVKFVNYIKTQYRKGIYEIHDDDLKKFMISHRYDQYAIDNLSIEPSGGDTSKINIIDDKKDLDGKYEDKCFDMSVVLDKIENFKLNKLDYDYYNETKINAKLETHLKKYFINAHKSTGSDRSFYDIVLGKKDIAIEIKLASSLSTYQRQRASGQLDEYIKKFKGEFLCLIFGTKEEKQKRTVQELKSKIEDDLDCEFYYYQVK